MPKGVPPESQKVRGGLWSNTSASGEHTLFSENGSLLIRGQYVNGMRQGTWNSYTNNGVRIASTGNYLNDWRDGVWKYYDTDENLYLIVNYKPFPRRDFFITRDYGNENGVYKRFFPDGSLEEMGYFKSGYSDGIVLRYYKNKKLAMSGNYNQDLMDGKWTYYYPEGGVERDESFKMGKKHGKFRNFHPDGTLYHETTYKEDIEIGPKILQREKTKFTVGKFQ